MKKDVGLPWAEKRAERFFLIIAQSVTETNSLVELSNV